MKLWQGIALLLIVVLVLHFGGSRDWSIPQLGKPQVLPTAPTATPPTTGTLPGATPTTPSGQVGAPYKVKGRLVFTNGSAITGQKITIYTPGADGTLISQGSEYTDSSGWFDDIQVREGAQYYVCADYNSTTNLETQWWGPMKMPWAREMFPTGWTNDYLLVPESPFVARVAPSSSNNLDIVFLHSDSSSVGSVASPTKLSKSGTSYLSADETFTIRLFLKQDWTAFGGKWTQLKTNQGHAAATYTSVVRVSVNATSGFTWKSSGWAGISGQATTTSKTMEVPRLEAFDENPVSIDITLKLNFNSATTNTYYTIKVDWIDGQEFDTVKEGSVTTRVSPNSGYIYLVSETYCVQIVA